MGTSKLLRDNLTKCWEVTCDGLVSHPGGVEILLVASYYENDKRRPDGRLARLVTIGADFTFLPCALPHFLSFFAIDAIDFHNPVKLGHIIHICGWATFTSSRSMEIEVIVDAKDYFSGKIYKPFKLRCHNITNAPFFSPHRWLIILLILTTLPG